MGDFDIYDWPQSGLGKKMATLEETMQCLICGDLYDNPHILGCGHSYCSICIRKHLDKVLNTSHLNTQCPTCKEKAELGHLKADRPLAMVIMNYKRVRNELLNLLKGNENKDCDKKRKRKGALGSIADDDDDEIVVSKSKQIERIPPLSLHNLTALKLKQLIIDLCNKKCQYSKPRLDGDKAKLESRYREIVLLNNAQLESLEPLTFDEVVEQVNEAETCRDKANKKYNTSNNENVKSKDWAEMIKSIKDRQNSTKPNDSSNIAAAFTVVKKNGKNSNNDSRDVIGAVDLNSSAIESSINNKVFGPWKVTVSYKTNSLFFYNIDKNYGQFDIPEEINDELNENFMIELERMRKLVGKEKPNTTPATSSKENHKMATQNENYYFNSTLVEDDDELFQSFPRGNKSSGFSQTQTMTYNSTMDLVDDDNDDDVIKESTSQLVTQWECKLCTLINPIYEVKCTVCFNPNPYPSSTVSTRSKNKVNEWSGLLTATSQSSGKKKKNVNRRN